MGSYNYVNSLMPDDSRLLAKYATPVPPSPASLLEKSERDVLMSTNHRYSDNRNSLLLDTTDNMGMELLISSASIDSQNFKVLSFEEVERLKREKALLTSRIDSHTRKLALESKVRDASQNLVRLHATKNKRMSKQAEDQLQNAARKVDDLATDLWRLQRREAAVKQQLLEHMAGILARKDQRKESARALDPTLSFDGKHLYKDSSMAFRESMSFRDNDPNLLGSDHNVETPASLSRSNISESVMRAEARLRETNKQLRLFLDSGGSTDEVTSNDDEQDDLDLEAGVDKLDSAILILQEQLLQQKEKALRSVETQQGLLSRLWETIEGETPSDFSETSLVRYMSEMSREMKILRSDASESKNRALDLGERHSEAMKHLQAEYEKELDDVHAELGQVKESHQDLLVNSTAHETERSMHAEASKQYDVQIQSLQNEMRQAQSTVGDLIVREAAAKQQSSTDLATIRRLEQQLADTHLERQTSQSNSQTELVEHKNMIDELEGVVAKLKAEVTVLADKHELSVLELQSYELQRAAEQRAHEAQTTEMRNKHKIALQHIDIISAEKQESSLQVQAIRAQAQEQVESLRDELKQLRNVVQQHESKRERMEFLESQETTLQELENELIRLTTENTRIKAEMDEMRGSKLEREKAQVEAAKDLLVRDLDAKVVTVEAELSSMLARNHSLQRDLATLQNPQSVPVSPLTRDTAFDGAISEREEALEARCNLLQAELDSMLLEYEAMTRTSLLHETDCTRQEDKMDSLLDRVLSLETQLAEEKVKLLGTLPTAQTSESPSSPRTNAESSATANLRRDFRKLVQDMRGEHAKQTRADYAEIKRLERRLASATENGRNKKLSTTTTTD